MQNQPPYENKWQEVYGYDRDPIREIIIHPLLMKEAGDLSGKDIIDVGCGNGSFILKLTSLKFTSAYCLDHSNYFLTEAKSVISDTRVRFIDADINNGLPFSDNTFHSIFSIFVLNELHNIESFFSEVTRTLKKNGVAHILCLHPFLVAYAYLYEKYSGKKNEKLAGNLDYKTMDKMDYFFTIADAKATYYQHTFEDINSALTKAGLYFDKLLELRTDDARFQKYPEYWNEHTIPKYLYLKLRKITSSALIK